jgi:hypothetical protein
LVAAKFETITSTTKRRRCPFSSVTAAARLLRQVETARKLRIAWRRYRLIALPEAAASAGLLIGYASAPFAAAAAAGLVVLMAGALAFRLRVDDAVGFLVGDAVLLGIAAATVALRIAG